MMSPESSIEHLFAKTRAPCPTCRYPLSNDDGCAEKNEQSPDWMQRIQAPGELKDCYRP